MSSHKAEQRLTRRQQRLSEKGEQKVCSIVNLHLEISKIVPKTDNQIRAFNAYDDDMNICLVGCAGTGKTFVSMYMALKEIADRRSSRRKLIIVRTAQPTKDIGFLPGSEKAKLEVYEAAYRSICAELYQRADAYDILKHKGIIEFHGTSFLRGVTIDDAIILIDEAQSMRYIELSTILTRAGQDTRIIVCGDTRQDDLSSERYKEVSGLPTLLKVLDKIDSVKTVRFEVDDIIRSGFVREFIEAEYEMGI